MAHMRSRCVHCPRCDNKAFLIVNLDKGTIESFVPPSVCKFPAICMDEFVAGAFDHQFGETIILPKYGVKQS